MTVFIDKTKWQVYAGDQWEFSFQVMEGDENSAEPVDLTEYDEWSAQWRQTADASDFIELTVSLPDPTNGIIIITADEDQTRDMGSEELPLGQFDVQAALPDVRTFYRGTTKWVEDVTRV